MGMNMPEVLEATVGYLRQLSSPVDTEPIEIDPKLTQEIEKAAEEAKQELDGKLLHTKNCATIPDTDSALESKIRDLKSCIVSQFTDLRGIPYRLQSVFVHRGYHNSGHYWIYIYDFIRNMWRKYNDGYVTEIRDTAEIFVQEPGDRPATPYFLVYVKDDTKEVLVDSVCRDPVEESPQEQQDTVMEDYSQAVELPTAVSSTYREINNSQEYGVTESYQNEVWSKSSGWDDATQEPPSYGGW